MTLKENDRVCDLVSDLRLEYEKTAFFAGFQVGIRLAEELREPGEGAKKICQEARKFS